MATGIIEIPVDLDTTSVWGMFYNAPVPPPPLVCTTSGTSAIAGYAVAGCMIAGKDDITSFLGI
jgi:hypothetical protein